MLSLSSLSGAIPLEDVRAALSQFTLEDAGQTAYVPMDCLVKGVSFKDSLPTTMAASQRGFDLLYYLPQGVATDGTALLVGNPDDKERAFVQLPSASANGTAPAATAQAETVAAEPTAAPTAPAEPLTSPASADILFNDTTYHITPIQIGTDENGKTTVTVSGYGDSLQIQDGKAVAHGHQVGRCLHNRIQSPDPAAFGAVSKHKGIHPFNPAVTGMLGPARDWGRKMPV